MTSLDENTILEANIQLDTITTNKAALQQVLLNLISNAIKYNSKATKIVTVDLTENNDYLLFSVSDNGNGILEKDYDKIFELFQTIENQDLDIEKGSGIGLATVKKVVKSLGGSIKVISKIGEGTVFEFSILK
jgi:signal transduction histidine kinase